MGEYMSQGWFTPDGQFSAGPAPGFVGHTNLTSGTWTPGNVQSENPYDEPYGDETTVGPISENIIGGELRFADDDFDGDVDSGLQR
jgi:hypothetical protein